MLDAGGIGHVAEDNDLQVRRLERSSVEDLRGALPGPSHGVPPHLAASERMHGRHGRIVRPHVRHGRHITVQHARDGCVVPVGRLSDLILDGHADLLRRVVGRRPHRRRRVARDNHSSTRWGEVVP